MSRPQELRVQIGRVVWHGPGAPSREALAAAVQAAVAKSLGEALPAEGNPAVAAAAAAIARQLEPALADAGDA